MIAGTRSVYFLYVAGSVILARAIQYAGMAEAAHHCTAIWLLFPVKSALLEGHGMRTLTRRTFVSAAALGPLAAFARSLRAAEYTFTQFHNQTATSSLHRRLVEMWTAIRTDTRGRVDTQVVAQNNRIAGGDPAALKMLVDGEIQFFTLMGGILGTVVPAAEICVVGRGRERTVMLTPKTALI